ncbi:MAG: hypothetical protein K2K31_02120, partial [Clostridia bacterium]|nr:hypothetical protein [Clostridia bacterium]
MDYKTLKAFLRKNNKDFEIISIGKSVLGKDIFAVNKTFDDNFKWVIITAGIHAREHLSCDFVCNFLEKLKLEESLPYNISVVPLVNPDGVDIAIHGISLLNKKTKEKLLKINNQNTNFSLYKANANGVDLNNNFDANWEKKFTEKFAPASQGFYGFLPMSEPETQALANWTKCKDVFLTLSYHLKGEEIYFDFFQNEKNFKRDEKIAKVFSKSTGYKIKSTQKTSSGGFKDWCVSKLRIPA